MMLNLTFSFGFSAGINGGFIFFNLLAKGVNRLPRQAVFDLSRD
jgi:hypothetical protein